MNYKKNKHISRRDFLLVEYIREVLNPSRRAFGGILGGAFAMALGINPNKSQAKTLNKIEEKLRKIAKKFLNIDGIMSSIFVAEGRILKFKLTLENEELKEIILNENEAFALSTLSGDYLDNTISKIKKSSEDVEDVIYNIRDFIEFLGKDYKKRKPKKSKSSEVEEITLDLDIDKETDFRQQCFDEINKRKSSEPLLCMLLEIIFKEKYCAIKKSARGNYNTIDFTLRDISVFFDKRDELVSMIEDLSNKTINNKEKENFKRYSDNFDEETPSNAILNTRKSGSEFISEFINTAKKFISINKEENELGDLLADIGLISVNFYTSAPWQHMQGSFK